MVTTPLHTIFPIAEVRGQFDKPVKLTQLGIPEYAEIVRQKPGDITNLALNVWNRIVHSRKPRVDPMALKSYIYPSGVSAKIVEGIEEAIGQNPIRDISYSCCHLDDSALENSLVARVTVAHVYPNDLHFCDMHYRDPYKPIPKQEQKYAYRTHVGLGLLRTTFERVEAYAAEHGMNYVTLTAAHQDLVPLFSEYGYKLESNDAGRRQCAMEKRIGG